MMWDATVETLGAGRTRRYTLRRDGAAVDCAEVLRCWRDDERFRSFYSGLLADAPYAAFRWETPALTSATIGKPFEFVLLDAPGLERPPEPEAFAEHFGRAKRDCPVVTFENLGKDAVLVVPEPAAAPPAYVHLAAFVRNAPAAQRHALWQAVATAMTQRLNAQPVWLSTAGAGVAWLHVRLDSRPKYYGFRPYATA